jgi:hypothetical protein
LSGHPGVGGIGTAVRLALLVEEYRAMAERADVAWEPFWAAVRARVEQQGEGLDRALLWEWDKVTLSL